MSKSEKQTILFMIFSPLFVKGGHSKNFLNLIKHLSGEFSDSKTQNIIISYNNSGKKVREHKKQIHEIQYFKPYLVDFRNRLFPSGNSIFQLFEFMLNFVRTFYVLMMYRPRTVYCYADMPLMLSFFWKKVLGFRLLFDMRGDIINEMQVQKKNPVKLNAVKIINHYARSKADLIFSVSSSFISRGKIKIYPKYNYYDGKIFKYNEEWSKSVRKEMDLDNKFVFVYTGNAHYYQMIEENLRFFGQFYNQYPDSYLIIITEYDHDKFLDILKNNKVPESAFLIKSLPQHKISELQSVADIGLLIRDNLPLNHHSFPTKFSEYLASGVPVLMTPHIHSIAPLVIKDDLGQVIGLKEHYNDEIENIHNRFLKNYDLKNRCSNYAKEHLMWQKKAHDIFQIINQ